jgi:ATP synthase F1 delta subunit
MMHPDIIKKYALAWYTLFGKELTFASIQNMQKAVAFLTTSKQLLFLLNYAVQEPAQVDHCIDMLCQEFELPRSLRSLFILLLQHDRIEFLLKIIEDIVALYKLEHSMIDVQIMTAHSASEEEISMLTAFFEKKSGMKALMTYTQDSSLIAGVRIESELWLWEASVKKQLRMLKHNTLFL